MDSTKDILKNIFRDKSPENTNISSEVGYFTEENKNGVPNCPLCQDRGIVLSGDSAIPCVCMQKKKIQNTFKHARLSRELMNCSFDKFDLNYYLYPDVKEREHFLKAQKALKASQDFVNNVLVNPHEIGLFFTGPVGSGKTFLAASIANALLEKERKLLFLVVPDLLDELKASFSFKNETSEFDLLDIARTVPILILDDLGAHNYTDWTRNRIYSILNFRMNEQLPTVITTNLDFNEIETYLGERTCSRLLQMCRIFRLTVQKDIRMQKYEKREGIK